MASVKGITSKAATGAVLVVVLFFGLKGCVGTVWTPPSEPTTYALQGQDRRSLAFVFLPSGKTYILYADQANQFAEAAATRMRGSYGTHYFWRLWSVDGPGTGAGLLGYRIYPEGSEPVVMEMTVLDKFVQGEGKTHLPAEGERRHPVILFRRDSIRFEGMWLHKQPTNTEFIESLRRRFDESG